LTASASSSAGDAQAALTDRKPVYRYEIPEGLSPEEKNWFKTFQEGNFLSEGWQEISAEIMAKTAPEQRAMQKVALDNLGRKIGLEWCRPNSIRKVNSSMLQEWGDILRKTARTNPQKLAWAIAYIDQEVDAVLD
jgi:hypothetical protein